MRAMVLRGKALAIEDVEVPKPGPNQVLAKVLACGICGSDLHAAKYMEDMIAASRLSGAVAWDSRASRARSFRVLSRHTHRPAVETSARFAPTPETSVP